MSIEKGALPASDQLEWLGPAFFLSYGKSRAGKSTDLAYAFPRCVAIAASMTAFEWSHGGRVDGIGYDPAGWHWNREGEKKHEGPFFFQRRTLEEATVLILMIAKFAPGLFDALMIDDFTLLAEATVADAEKNAPVSKKGNKDAFYAWDVLRAALLEMRDAAHGAGLHVGISAHTREPGFSKDTGKGWMGGPLVPSKEQTQALPAICSTVVRVGSDSQRWGEWKGVYHCVANQGIGGYVEGDRLGVFPRCGPMNLGEALRRKYGIAVPGAPRSWQLRRIPGLEWIDPVADKIADRVAVAAAMPAGKGETLDAIASDVAQKLLGKGKHHQHVAWALRDGFDRALLAQHVATAALGRFGLGGDGKAAASLAGGLG